MEITKYHCMCKHKYANTSELEVFNYDMLICYFSQNERSNTICKNINAKTIFTLNECRLSCNKTLCKCKKNDLTSFLKNSLEGYASIAIDITEFPSKNLLELMMILYDKGITKYDIFYVEPSKYKKAEDTEFYPHSKLVPVNGYSVGCPNTNNSLVIINPGYNPSIFKDFIDSYKNKEYLLTFPPTSLDMFQQNYYNLIKADLIEGDKHSFAPAYDPFLTAFELKKIIENKNQYDTFTLLPLATKPQVAGFGIYYINEVHTNPNLENKVFVYLPEFPEDISEKSSGIKNIWRYKIQYKV